ncbi:MAG TPA: nucleotidyltransferase domain-containing protein [Mycobacterium sp.]|nr:nucleotidyltransferase domain-containing protein [Mycobacterium sp.]
MAAGANQDPESLKADPKAPGSPSPAADAGGEDVLHDVVRVASRALGDRLIAVYALGSLAHGGFSPLVSDVDVAVVLADPAQQSDPESILGIADEVRGIGSELHSRVSIFWGTLQTLRGGAAEGRFPPLDRLCLFEHGRLLLGSDIRGDLLPPSQTELLLAGAQFALDLLAETVIAYAADPADLLAKGVRWTTKIVLFPVRFLFTADTGREGTNDAAVQHYSTHHRGPAAELVSAAFSWRTKPPANDHAVALLKNGFVPLYRNYLDDHIQRLQSINEPELADRFSEWRSRLLAACGD